MVFIFFFWLNKTKAEYYYVRLQEIKISVSINKALWEHSLVIAYALSMAFSTAQ